MKYKNIPAGNSVSAQPHGTDRPTDQLTNRPTDRPTNRPTDQTTKRPTGQQSNRLSYKGFTLLELMIVVSIVGILATIAQPSMKRYVVRAKESSLRNTLFVFRDVIDQYYGDHGKYPDDLSALVKEEYIRTVPADPFTRSAETWILIPPPDGTGIFDVHSGSDLVSLGGTPYNEW